MRSDTERPIRILGIKDLKREKGLYGPTHIRNLMREGKFPAPRQLRENRIGWLEHEIDDWILSRPLAQHGLAA